MSEIIVKSLDFSLSHVEAGVLEVRQLKPDSLACDDAAWAILSPPRKLTVLFVTTGNIVLESALQACPLAQLELRSPEEFEAIDFGVLSVEKSYDVIVLDNHMTREQESAMNQSKPFARLQNQDDYRMCMLIIGFVYSPLVLMLGAAALIGLG